MTDEAFPIEIRGETLFLRFSDEDISEGSGGVEAYVSLFVADHPVNRTYDKAAIFLWRGLRRKDNAGNMAHALPQDQSGKKIAFAMAKEFCRRFSGIDGMTILYGSIDKALIVSGWRRDPNEKTETLEKSTQEVPVEKN